MIEFIGDHDCYSLVFLDFIFKTITDLPNALFQIGPEQRKFSCIYGTISSFLLEDDN
jgi:hypothetical protein